MRIFFVVLARDRGHVEEKVRELVRLGVPYVVVCGERLNHPNVVYRAPVGKYDAINFGVGLVPRDVDVIVLHDVDTKIHNFKAALRYFKYKKVAVVFAKIVLEGPQNLFFRMQDAIKRRILILANGELMLVRSKVLKEILPLKPCKAEDTYILFKALELGYKAIFCEETYIETERTKSEEKEEIYKRINVAGIYQALFYTKPPPSTRLFYFLLPFMSLLFLVLGRKGYYWMRGILLGFLDYIRGDRSGTWQPTYMERGS